MIKPDFDRHKHGRRKDLVPHLFNMPPDEDIEGKKCECELVM
jgi:hypothetical protein